MTFKLKGVPIANAVELHRLVAIARSGKLPDGHPGKRNSTRFATVVRLEVSTDPANPTATWPGQMHNISKTGLSFWGKRQIGYGTRIYFREFSPDTARGWLPGQVTHCTVGIRGYLIGARIDREALRP